jgi:hypothetical protein
MTDSAAFHDRYTIEDQIVDNMVNEVKNPPGRPAAGEKGKAVSDWSGEECEGSKGGKA